MIAFRLNDGKVPRLDQGTERSAFVQLRATVFPGPLTGLSSGRAAGQALSATKVQGVLLAQMLCMAPPPTVDPSLRPGRRSAGHAQSFWTRTVLLDALDLETLDRLFGAAKSVVDDLLEILENREQRRFELRHHRLHQEISAGV